MDDRRRRQTVGEHYHQESPRTPTRSQSRKPPPAPGSWQPTVPSWEKKFCFMVGLIPWGKLLEAKKLMSFYENVLHWNDSAGEEAFNNAKNRFWAEINGLPCDISLPDPDIYIDKIDWNSDIDPELLLDLERELTPPDEDDKEKSRLIGDSLFFLNRPVPCSGWGDAEEENPVKTVDDSLRPGLQDCGQNANNGNNPWESECAGGNNTLESNTWGDYGANSWDSNNQWENNNGENPEPRSNGNWGGTWKRDTATQHMSRYKTSRFQGAEYQMDHGWKNGRGRKRVNFSYEHPLVDKKPLASQPWNSIHSCGPISHHGSREAGNPWSWEKPVSYELK